MTIVRLDLQQKNNEFTYPNLTFAIRLLFYSKALLVPTHRNKEHNIIERESTISELSYLIDPIVKIEVLSQGATNSIS